MVASSVRCRSSRSCGQTQQAKPVAEPFQQRRWRKRTDTGGRQARSQAEARPTAAQISARPTRCGRSARSRVRCRRTGHEQRTARVLNGRHFRSASGGTSYTCSPTKPQRLPARLRQRDASGAPAAARAIRSRAAANKVLQIVEQQQDLLVARGSRPSVSAIGHARFFPQPERLRERRREQLSVAQRSQTAPSRHRRGNVRQLSPPLATASRVFPIPPGPVSVNKPHLGIAAESPAPPQFRLTTDERRRDNRQVVRPCPATSAPETQPAAPVRRN